MSGGAVHVYREFVTRTIYIRKTSPYNGTRTPVPAPDSNTPTPYCPLPKISARAWRASVPSTVMRYSILNQIST